MDKPFLPAGSQVVGDNGHHAVVQAKNGHEGEGLHLEIDAQHGGGGGGEGNEDLIEPKNHHGADGAEDNRGHAHGVDAPNGGTIRPEPLGLKLDFRVIAGIEEDGEGGADHLPQHRGRRRSGHLHAGEGAQAENQHRVHDDVHNGPRALANHGAEGPPRGLEQAFKHDGDKNAKAQGGADGNIGGPAVNNLLYIGLNLKEGPGNEHTQYGKGNGADHRQKDAVGGRLVGPVVVLFPQTPGEQGVDAHAGAHPHGYHQILDGKGHGNRRQGVLADLGHKDTVHNVVQGLNEHGEHNGQGHGNEQPFHRHDAHFVFLHLIRHRHLRK